MPKQATDTAPDIDVATVRNTARWLRQAPMKLEDEDFQIPRKEKSKALYIRDRARARLQGDTQKSVLAIAKAWRSLCTLEGISHDPDGEFPSLNDEPLQDVMQRHVDKATGAIDDAPFACEDYASLYNEVMDLVHDVVEECARRVGLQSRPTASRSQPTEATQLSMFSSAHNDQG